MMILRHMQTAKDWHIEDNERGKKLTIFPTEGRKERGGRDKGWTCLKMKQISLTLNSDYSVVKIPLTTGLDNYPALLYLRSGSRRQCRLKMTKISQPNPCPIYH